VRVTDEQLKEVEYEQQRNKSLEENKRKLALVLQTKYAVSEQFNASQPQKKWYVAFNTFLFSLKEANVASAPTYLCRHPLPHLKVQLKDVF
jgi:hypothetical protein